MDPLVSDLAYADDESELVKRFRAGLPARVAAVEDATRTGDYPTLKRLSHTLRGAGACFGYPAIASAAEAVERAVTKQDSAGVRSGVRALVEVCERAWAIAFAAQ